MKGKTVERIKREEEIERAIKQVAEGITTLFFFIFQNTEKEG